MTNYPLFLKEPSLEGSLFTHSLQRRGCRSFIGNFENSIIRGQVKAFLRGPGNLEGEEWFIE